MYEHEVHTYFENDHQNIGNLPYKDLRYNKPKKFQQKTIFMIYFQFMHLNNP